MVHPDQHEALALLPEFIVPQDGVEKQACELAAAKRWLAKQEGWLQKQKAVILGDDLFNHQPFCQLYLTLS